MPDVSTWAERIINSQRVSSEAYLCGDEPPTRNQIAAVIRSLADFSHNQHMVSEDIRDMGSDRSEFGDKWAHATGLGRYFHALADHIETGWPS